MLFQMLANLLLLMVVIGVEKIPTPCAKLPKTAETFSNKIARIFQSMGDDSSATFNDFDVDGCNISEVIFFLQSISRMLS
jgi:hypothetical protein